MSNSRLLSRHTRLPDADIVTSPWNGGEGPSTTSNPSLPQAILEALVLNQTNRPAILAGKLDPSKASDAFTSYEKFTAALGAAGAKGNVGLQDLVVQNLRIFYPKGHRICCTRQDQHRLDHGLSI